MPLPVAMMDPLSLEPAAMRILTTLALAMFLLAMAPAHAAPGGGYALQMPGAFHGGEPVALHGEAWLALVVDGQGARLEEVVLSVLPVHDSLVDAVGEQSGFEVGADGVEALAFLRGPDLVAGPVRLDLPEPVGMVPGLKLWLDPQHTAILGLECSVFDGVPGSGSCFVGMSDDMQSITLAEVPATVTSGGTLLLGDDGRVEVLFAGDLNGDGATDLLIDVSMHYNLVRPVLFLTQPDGNHISPVQVAEYESVGC